MNLRTNCPKCGLDKLSHTVQEGDAFTVRCRNCKWTKKLDKPVEELTDQDYE